MGRVRLGKRRMIGISETGYREVAGIMKRLQGIIDHSPARMVEKLAELGYNTKHRLSLGSVVIAMSDLMRRLLDGQMIFIPTADIPGLEKRIAETVATNVKTAVVSTVESMGATVERAEIFPDRIEVQYMRDGERMTAMFGRVSVASALSEQEWFERQEVEKVAD